VERRHAAFEPERRRRCRATDVPHRLDLRFDVVDGERLVVERALLPGIFLPLREFLIGEKPPRAELPRPLEGHADHIRAGPDPLQIGIAPRRLRQRVRLRFLRAVDIEDVAAHAATMTAILKFIRLI